jgi:hypothetical protein
MDRFAVLVRSAVYSAGFSIVLGGHTEQAFADYQIIRSTLPKWERGLTLSPEATLDLKKGDELDLFDLVEGRTLVVRGPYAGTLKNYVSDQIVPLEQQKQIETTGASRFVTGIDDSISTTVPKSIEDRVPQED